MSFLTLFVISNPTGDDEHDACGEAHLGLGRVGHAVHREAGQGEDRYECCEDTQHHTHYHQGSHCLEGTYRT